MTAWKATVGTKPATIVVYERWPGGPLYARVWDSTTQRPVVRSLKHRNREKAMAWANETAAKLAAARSAETGMPQAGRETPRDPLRGTVLATVRGVVTLYLAKRTPLKATRGQQQEDRRRGAMWIALYGDRPVSALGANEWNEFIQARRSGAITPRGDRVRKLEDRRPVGARGVDADLVFLISVFNWAAQTPRSDQTGDKLIAANPWGGVGIGVKRALARPRNRAIRRPVATTERYELLLQAADTPRCLMPALGEGAKRVRAWEPTYLSPLLVLAYHTGRRITAICSVTRDRLVRNAQGAIIAVRWPPLKDEDERPVGVRAEVAAALEAQLSRVDDLAALIGWKPGPKAAVFPQPRALVRYGLGGKVATEPKALTRWTATEWLHEAELAAELERMPQGGWHPFRRSWATRRKHLPRKDVAETGGWKDEATMVRSYEHADVVTTNRVILDDTRL